MSQDDFLKALLAETREEINRADTKANILLAGAGIAVAAAVSGFTASDWTLAGERGAVQSLAITAFGCALLGVFLLGWAVYPRIGRATPGRARYFMDQAQYETVEGLREAVKREADHAAERYISQLHALAPRVKRKYELTQAGEIALAAAVAAAVAAGVAHHLLGA